MHYLIINIHDVRSRDIRLMNKVVRISLYAFDYSWLLQENGSSMCSNGKHVRISTVPTAWFEPGTT